MHDESEIVELLDPDWPDHFRDAADAVAHYKRWAPAEWADAVREFSGDE